MWSSRVAFALRGTLCRRQRFVPKYIFKREPVQLTQTRHAAFMVPIKERMDRIGAIPFGRKIRQWWAVLPQPQTLRRVKYTLYAIGGVVGLGAMLAIATALEYYVSHLESDPITGRRRFIMFSENDLHEMLLSTSNETLSMFKSLGMLPTDVLHYEVAKEITQQLLSTRATERMESTPWKLYLVDIDVLMAFAVYPTGEIYLSTGTLRQLQDRDELAFVVAHEIAHVLLQHKLEKLTRISLLEMFCESPAHMTSIVAMGAIWSAWKSGNDVDPQLALESIHYPLMWLFFYLPLSRKMELEADELGLMIAAKAGFDPSAGPRMYRRWDSEEALEGLEVVPEYLSTHPRHSRRSSHLEALLPRAYAVAKATAASSDKTLNRSGRRN